MEYTFLCLHCSREMKRVPDEKLEEAGRFKFVCTNCRETLITPQSNKDVIKLETKE